MVSCASYPMWFVSWNQSSWAYPGAIGGIFFNNNAKNPFYVVHSNSWWLFSENSDISCEAIQSSSQQCGMYNIRQVIVGLLVVTSNNTVRICENHFEFIFSLARTVDHDSCSQQSQVAMKLWDLFQHCKVVCMIFQSMMLSNQHGAIIWIVKDGHWWWTLTKSRQHSCSTRQCGQAQQHIKRVWCILILTRLPDISRHFFGPVIQQDETRALWFTYRHPHKLELVWLFRSEHAELFLLMENSSQVVSLVNNGRHLLRIDRCKTNLNQTGFNV